MSRSTASSVRELIDQGALQVGDGYRTKRAEHGRPGFRIIRVADVMDDVVMLDGSDFVSEEHREQIGSKLGQPGDIVLTTKGTIGRVAVMPELDETVVYSPQLCFFRIIDESALHPRYLRYWFSSPAFKSQASHRMNNTDMAAYINLADIRSLQIYLPPLSVQRAIAEVLGALDDKIAANAKLVESADALAAAVFSSMFGTSEERPLTEVARFVNGKAFTKGASGTGRVVIRIAELNSGIGNSTVYSDIEVPEQHIARPGNLLFAWSGSLTLHRWFRTEAIVNQHIFKIVPLDGYPTWCAYGLIAKKLEEFRAIAADKATTMGHIQRRHLEEPVSTPSMSEIRRHDANMTALWERALLAEQESLSLSETRDALLPPLMSGAIRVRDAEKRVEEVL